MITLAPEWRCDTSPVSYETALADMEDRVAAIRSGGAPELIWLLEHPPVYTAGTSARPEDLLNPAGIPVHRVGRGGQYTYHGPGQRVGYVMLDLSRRGQDIRRFVCDLEDWLILALADFGVEGARREGRVGIWVERGGGREDKIAALGIRVRRWVSFHGIALNVAPDLSRFEGIVPCGIADPRFGVTSLADLGVHASAEQVDAALKRAFEQVFLD